MPRRVSGVPGRRRLAYLLGAFAVAGGVVAGVACNVQGFDPQSRVDSVRLLAVKADKPYANPGEVVTLEALVADARPVKPRPLKIYWIPIVCLNPRDDLYYQCFAPTPDGGVADGGTRFFSTLDAGAAADAAAPAPRAGSPLDSIPAGIDLGPFLPQGRTFTFTMPGDAIIPRVGTSPYGLAVIFNIACAGRVELATRNPTGGPQQVPILCKDEAGNALPPRDYVIGISRVYSYGDRTNKNPILEKVTLDGKDVDLNEGITLDRCTTERSADCKENKLDVVVSEASWEPNPSEVTREGAQPREQIWVDYYSNIGQFDNEARLLFDVTKGKVQDSAVTYRSPRESVAGSIWAVVHDNRGGAAWVVFPVRTR